MIRAELLKSISSIRHGFFTREDGVSSGEFNSLNCGYGSGDAPEKVRKNRAIAISKLGLKKSKLNTVLQEHSNVVAVADKTWTIEARPRADAIVTKEVGLAIGVLTADCAPVLFVDDVSKVIGVCHAGWRGALSGVLEACVLEMETLGANRSSISTVVGPCIHQKSYEVGPEFKNEFVIRDKNNVMFFCSSTREGFFLFDLPGYICGRLDTLSLKKNSYLPFDTYELAHKFFSYRRSTHQGESNYGRGLSAIVLVE